MTHDKVSSFIAVSIIILISGIIAFVYLHEAEPVTETLQYGPKAIQQLIDLNQKLSSTSSQVAP